MTIDFILRRAVEADVPDITRIYNHAVLRTTATFDMEPKTHEDRLRWFRGHDDRSPLIVATLEGKVVGWGAIHQFGDRLAYRYTVENAVYVDCDYQGRGIGGAILRELIELARELGYHVILALVVGGNESSARLHEKFGFQRVGVLREVGRKFDAWLDLIAYELVISQMQNAQ